MTPPIAVIDVGSNSIKLLVAQAGEVKGSLETLFTETIETRISAGISHELPSLSDEAILAGTETIAELQRMAGNFHPGQIAVVATSAVRDALNGRDFTQSVLDTTGLQIRVLSGEEEATLIGRGLSCDPAIAGMKRFIQTDIGGGSLELIRFEDGEITKALSLQLGAVRISERFIKEREGPLCAETEAAIREHVHQALSECEFDFFPHSLPLVATGGAYTVSRAVLAAKAYSDMGHSSARLERKTLDCLKKQLASLPLHERLATPHLPAARADILPTALITIDTLLDYAERDHLTHSFYNLRYGMAAKILTA
jgi:exopolyphosphatase/guanosine-5'-triphosphate,3'-diphosphate pyrophosphatase